MNAFNTLLEAVGLTKHPGEKQLPPKPPQFNRRAADRPLGDRELRRMYDRPRSFCDKLPWIDYLDEHEVFLLDDGVSVGAMLDVTPVSTEGRSMAFKAEIRDSIERALQDSFDEYDDGQGPWVVQFFCYDQSDLEFYVEHLRGYVWERARGTQFTEAFLDTMQEHLQGAAKAGGLFDDPLTESAWSARIRRVHVAIYRRWPKQYRHPAGMSPMQECNEAVTRFMDMLGHSGIRASRMDAFAFHNWLFRWFNPHPDPLDPSQFKEFYRNHPWGEEAPFGHTDFAEGLLTSWPRTDLKTQTWWFDGLPHRCVTLEKLRGAPKIGLLTGETAMGSEGGGAAVKVISLFDKLPESCILSQTVIITPQDVLENHLNQLDRKAIGETAESVQTRKDVEAAKNLLASGHKLFKGSLAFYLRGQDVTDLRKKQAALVNMLSSHGLQLMREQDEQCGIDAYLLHLPMAYDPLLDRDTRFARYMYAQHIANLSPLFGRARGTGNPGLSFFNRGGEPLCFDPLNMRDRKKNAHALLLGPTGAGKSATLVGMITQLLGIVRPRLFVIEAGNSFGLLADYCAANGLTVNKVALKPGAGVSIPPFADAWRLLEEARTPSKEKLSDVEFNAVDDLIADDQEDDEQRDLMGEMEIIAMLMITGGDEKEVERFDRADRRIIRDAILGGASTAHGQGRQTMTGDIRNALYVIARDDAEDGRRRERARYMADCLGLFCDGLEGELFNREGSLWPEVDLTLIDLATYAREGYGPQLAVAYTSIMNRINNLAERYQHDERPLIMITDEGHIITTNPLLAPYVVKVVKMWRKLGAWYWVATQNLEDFPNAAKKMLNMIEWWMLLVMPKEEVEQVGRFRDLTPEQRQLLLSARKEPGKYTEGVVLSSAMESLFRIVPPSLHLALAMTEKDEKVERRRLMDEFDITEVEAAARVAERLNQKRGLA